VRRAEDAHCDLAAIGDKKTLVGPLHQSVVSYFQNVDSDKTKAVETEPGTDMPLVRDIRSRVLAFRTGGIDV